MKYSEWIESECACHDTLPCERCMASCYYCGAYLDTHEHCAEYEKIYGPADRGVK